MTDYIKSKGERVIEGSSSLEELEFFESLVRENKITSVAEIGFNAGLSAYTFLFAKPNVFVTSFDLGEHGCVTIAKDYLDQKFPGRHQLILGDSKKTLLEYRRTNPKNTFDLILIDGGHNYSTAYADIINSQFLARPNTLVIMDDLNLLVPWGIGPVLAWTKAIRSGLVSLDGVYKNSGPTRGYLHLPLRSNVWGQGRYIRF